MLIFILFVSVLVKVTLGAVTCSVDPLEVCREPTLFNRIPLSAEEFSELCP
ncbi:hypothetical protein NPIL_330371, partial [Nephila pilipes]